MNDLRGLTPRDTAILVAAWTDAQHKDNSTITAVPTDQDLDSWELAAELDTIAVVTITPDISWFDPSLMLVTEQQEVSVLVAGPECDHRRGGPPHWKRVTAPAAIRHTLDRLAERIAARCGDPHVTVTLQDSHRGAHDIRTGADIVITARDSSGSVTRRAANLAVR